MDFLVDDQHRPFPIAKDEDEEEFGRMPPLASELDEEGVLVQRLPLRVYGPTKFRNTLIIIKKF
jgi:hypothetical protein